MRPSLLLAALAVALAAITGCSQSDRMSLACEHCYCGAWASRDLRHPVSCETLHYDIECCFADSS